MHEVIYEIFNPFDQSYVTDTEDEDEAEELYRKGYLVYEHKLDKIPVTRKTQIKVIVTEQWGVEH